ncbi:hypothetical protein [Escherichia coli]
MLSIYIVYKLIVLNNT